MKVKDILEALKNVDPELDFGVYYKSQFIENLAVALERDEETDEPISVFLVEK